MTPAKLWLSLFFAPFALCLVMLMQTLFCSIVPYGDLSRIGRIDDLQFGFRVMQPQIDARLLRSVPVAQADILVIGDSFSAQHHWQAPLVQAGHAVSTLSWGQVGDALCSNLDAWLAGAGFRGKLVVIESVERMVTARLAESKTCDRLLAPPGAPFEPLPSAATPASRLDFSRAVSPFDGWLTRRCTDAAVAGERRSLCNPDVIARPVAHGCELFTHLRCDLAPFFADDARNGEIDPGAVRVMQAFGRAHRTVPLLWMVVPNKSTAYLEPGHSHRFVEGFAGAGLGPDLFAFAQQEKTAMRDFYLPNDTHLSVSGQLALGERMLQAVREKLGGPPEPGGD